MLPGIGVTAAKHVSSRYFLPPDVTWLLNAFLVHSRR